MSLFNRLRCGSIILAFVVFCLTVPLQGQSGPILSITKSHNGDFTTGQPGTYFITVSNVGQAATSGTVTLTDVLPQGMTAIALDAPGWSCTALPTTLLTCTRSDSLAPNSSYPVVALTVSLGNCMSTETNTAAVTGGGDSQFHSASDPTNIHTPTLAITVSHTGNFTVGQTGTYTITVSNVGSVATSGIVKVRDPLPVPNLTGNTADGVGWDCSGLPSGFIICDNGNPLQPGASYPPITITVNVIGGASSVTNVAEVDGGGDGVLHQATDPTNIIGPILAITSSHTGTFNIGQTGSYTLTVTNTGPVATLGTVLAGDDLPDIVDIRFNHFRPLLVTSISGPGWTCTTPPPNIASCTRSDSLAPGASYPPITVTVNVVGGAPSVTNNGIVSGGGDSQPRLGPDPTNINGGVLSITKTHPGDFTGGHPGVYTITIFNTGTGPTLGQVVVEDQPPFGLVPTSVAGPGWNCSFNPFAPHNVSCDRSDAVAANSAYPPITLTVDVGGSDVPSVTNQADVFGGGDGTIHFVSDVTNIHAPKLNIAKSHTGNFAIGGTGTYTIVVSNIGPFATAGTVTFDDPLPAGLAATSATGAGWSCSGTTEVICQRSDSLAPSSTYPPISLTVSVTGGSPSVTNTAFVTGGGDALTRVANDLTNIDGPSLTIVKSHANDLSVGVPGSYSIVVGNNGKAATFGTVTVSDTLPPNVTATAVSGTGWSCSGVTTVTCTRSDVLATASSYPPISLTVVVDPSAQTKLIINTATVSGGGDGVLHSSSDPTTVHTPTLGLTKTHSGTFAVGQTTGTYTITVSNTSSLPTSGKVFLNDNMPVGVAATNLNAPGWNCVPGEIFFSCSRSDSLAGGASYPSIVVSTRVDFNAAATVTNFAHAFGGGDPSGQVTQDVVNVTLPDLAITKTHQGDFTPRLPGTYTITVTNVGTIATAGGLLTVGDTLPKGLMPTAISGTDWNCSIDTNPPVRASCNRNAGTLAPGSSYPAITLTVDVASDAPSAVTNIVDVSGISDANLNNNSASDITNIIGLRLVPVTPCRVADTRNPNGAFGGPFLGAGTSRAFPIPDSSCGIPNTALAYSLNATVVPKGSLGFLTMFPCGEAVPLASTLNSLDGRVKAGAAIVPAGTSGAVCAFVTNDTDLVLDINGYFVPSSNTSALAFYPLTPCRIVDTRGAAGALSGPSLVANAARSFPILSSSCSVPSTAQAYSLNYTSVPKGILGFLTTWPTGQAQPLVSTLNAPTGTVTANAAIVPIGTNGDISVFVTHNSDLVIDIDGYFAPPGAGGLSLFPATPCRVLDTRNPAGSQPFKGTINVDVAGSGCSVPATAQAFVLNSTVVPPGPLGFLTLWPQGATQPLASTLNAGDGAVTSNMAIVPTTNGSISAFVPDLSHLVLDISGFFAP